MKNTNEFQIVFDKNLSSMVTLVDLSEILPEKWKTQLLWEKIAVLLQMSISFDDVDAALSACNQLLTNYKKAELLFLARNEHKNAQNYRSKIEQIEKIISFIDSTIIPTRQSLDDKINEQVELTSTIEEQIALWNFSWIENNKAKLHALRNNLFHPNNTKITVQSNAIVIEDEVVNLSSESINWELTKNQAEVKIKNIFSEYYPNKLKELDDKKIIWLLEKESFTWNDLDVIIRCCMIWNIFDRIIWYSPLYVERSLNDAIHWNKKIWNSKQDFITKLKFDLLKGKYTEVIEQESIQLLKLNYIYEAIIKFIKTHYPNENINALKSLELKNKIIKDLYHEIEELEKNNDIKFG